MSFTLIIVVIISLVSLAGFNNEDLRSKLLLWPKRMDGPGEYYRFLTCGFVHSDYMHLIFNMLALYSFGEAVEMYFGMLQLPVYLFPVLFLSGIVASSIPSYMRHKNNAYYRSLGASGGVSAVVFAAIYFAPWNKIILFVFPIPGIILAITYVIYSAYMDKKGNDNIGHDAHLWGAVYGFLFTLVFEPSHGKLFIDALMHPSF